MKKRGKGAFFSLINFQIKEKKRRRTYRGGGIGGEDFAQDTPLSLSLPVHLSFLPFHSVNERVIILRKVFEEKACWLRFLIPTLRKEQTMSWHLTKERERWGSLHGGMFKDIEML
ncbi:MAG: hypothetical protein WAN35_18425 [Terracidiphilus sp.]